MSNFYVYSLIDPKDYSTYYIGKGKEDRCYNHFQNSYLQKATNPHKCNLIKKRRRNGYKPKNWISIIQGSLSESDACDLEKFIISEIGLENLTNLKPGGQEMSGENHPRYGKSHTKQTKKKISKSLSGKNSPLYNVTGKDHPAYGNLSKVSKEGKKKISKANRGEGYGGSKLTKKEAKEIKWLAHNSNMKQQTIGDKYGVSNITVCDIKNENSWKHIEDQKPNWYN